MKSKKFWWLIVLPVIGLLVVIWQTPLGELLRNPQQLNLALQKWGHWIPLITISLHVLQVLTAPIPGTAIDAVNGLLFGPWLGTVYSMIGIMVGSTLVMGLARRFGRPLVERFVNPASVQRLDQMIAKRGSLVIFLLFLLPFLPDDAVCFLAGLTTIPLLELVLLVLIGRLPGVFMANFLGSQTQSINSWQWIVIGAAFILLAGLVYHNREEIRVRIVNFLEKVME